MDLELPVRDSEEQSLLHSQQSDNFNEDKKPSIAQTHKPAQSFLSLLLRALILSLSTWALIDLSHKTWTIVSVSKLTQDCYCGTTPSEAMGRGCGYDHVLGAWIPEHCQDKELSKIYNEMSRTENHKWVYYDYPNGTRQLTELQVSMLAGIDPNMGAIITTEDWHMSHCLYVWLRLSRKELTGTTMTPREDDPEHAMHCVGVIWGNLKKLSYMNDTIALTGVFMFPEAESSG